MQNHTPIIIHVPHASTWIPESEKKYFVTHNLQHEINVMTDHFCDDLFDIDGRQIIFPISRLVCDPERFRDVVLGYIGKFYDRSHDRNQEGW